MSQKPNARYYRGARTTHLERLRDSTPGDFYYQKPMYDFDASAAPAGVRVQQMSFLRVVVLILRGAYGNIEIVEPYAPSALPQNVALSIAARLGKLLHDEPTKLVTYAIENADLPRKFASSTHIPLTVTRMILRYAVGFCYRSLDRIVFGTADAQQNYAALLGDEGPRSGPKTTLIWGLPVARSDEDSGIRPSSSNRHQVTFVGAFDERKGVRQLMESWSDVLRGLPQARLHIVGKGAFEAEIRVWAKTATNVTVTIDPPREAIWDAYRETDVLVLLSQPFPNWKEQIGLPIVEGLSFGAEIVSSTETGIARWLLDHGHLAIDPGTTRAGLAAAILQALRTRRPRDEILQDLPAVDGRLAADLWLFRAD